MRKNKLTGLYKKNLFKYDCKNTKKNFHLKTFSYSQNFSTMPYFGIFLLNSQGYKNSFLKHRF